MSSEWSKPDDIYKNRDQMLERILNNSEFNKELLKELKEEVKVHIVSDEAQFTKIREKQAGTDVRMAYYAGGLAVIGILLKLLFKV